MALEVTGIPRLLSTAEVRDLTGFSLLKIRALIQSKRLPAVNTSTGQKPRYAIRLEDLQAFLTPDQIREKETRKAAQRPRRRAIDEGLPQII